MEQVQAALGPEYRILSLIGSGGMGSVYAAKNEGKGTRVAIKVIRGADQYSRQRFQRESLTQAKLHHPNILPLLDAGERDDLLYLVTPLVDGDNLESILKRRQLTVAEALTVTHALARALTYAHQYQVIHRDLKPSNILIPSVAGSYRYDQAQVADFSVVGLLEKDTQATRVGQVFGTPRYMSPEQIRGERQSEATDVYGLGLLLYEMIYGKLPFSAGDAFTLMQEIVTKEVDLPANPDLPKPLKIFILACLQKNPANRPSEPEKSLAEFLAPEPATALGAFDNADVTYENRAASRKKSTTGFYATIIVGLLIATFAILLVFDEPLGLRSLAEIRESWDWQLAGGILLGIAFIASGILLGGLISHWLRKQQGEVRQKANEVLFGLRSREDLSNTLAVEINELISRCRAADEKILGSSVAIMIDEYRSASSFDDRQTALVTAVEFLEKLSTRLSPWYVKYDKLIVALVSILGLVSGVIKILDTLSNT